MHDEFAPRRLTAWTLSALSAVMALTLAGLGWQWVLAGCASAAGYYYIVYRLCRAPLTQAAIEAFGRTGGTVLLVLTLGWTLIAAAASAAGADMAYPEDALPWLAPACVLLLSAFGGWHGTHALSRAAGVVALLLGFLYLTVLLTAAGQAEAAWCRPWGTGDQAAKTFFALLAASAALYLPGAGGRLRRPWGAFAVGILVPVAAACLTSGCLSPQVTARTAAPFYAMSRSLSLLGVVERFEPVVSAALLTGLFCLTGLLTQSGAEMVHAILPRIPVRWCAVGCCALAGALIPAAKRMPQTAQAIAAGIFWGVLPVLTLSVVAIKKGGKNTKKRLDKRDFL